MSQEALEKSLLKKPGVQFLHLDHLVRHARFPLQIRITQHLLQPSWDNLPRKPKLIGHPSALLFRFIAPVFQVVPVVVDLVLILTVDLEGDRPREFELGAAIQSCKSLSVQFEFNNHNAACLSPVVLFSSFGVALDCCDLGVGEDGDVESGGFFGLAVEPEAWGYL
ncbi:hypothetical protein BA78_8859 [Aspergillus fumigatus]|nr:hypothetical protein BA78_8859 [Aspergillus fumigatus]